MGRSPEDWVEALPGGQCCDPQMPKEEGWVGQLHGACLETKNKFSQPTGKPVSHRR